ncbi:hypothetical protein F444_20275 [Plasmopara halstedii]|uniref:HTH CENPB-type domain-containing protein n=1 Tax=Plasmopara halstedii TaxID=4781 RepID=A0A0P1B601_PLAHL|nr:hypothetical protein F444_20275 [Plasmopara halstedii]CEG50232.1 hypothetical protein F444_20275 [Plasmopara halstedii]|eukprot:XP_024586601.1 hypothetical protein F444_20275 [Plasmopara halstedii]
MVEAKRQSKRTHLTLQQKGKLRSFLIENTGLAQSDVAEWVFDHFHVRLGRTTLYRIQHAPEEAFTRGNLGHKKQRRVKFPVFEKRLLEFYEKKCVQKEHVTDDVLLRHAAECRAACGIGESELKLSNGWLYRFKIRHQLTGIPPQTRRHDDSEITENTSVEVPLLSSAHVPSIVHIPAGNKNTGEILLMARSLTTLKAPGFFNWEPMSRVQQGKVQIVTDGILMLQEGVYQLNVDVKHSASGYEVPVFRIYSNNRVVGQSVTTTLMQNDVASSICVDTTLLVNYHDVLRIEFLASGFAFTDSSLVLRLIDAKLDL